MSLTARRILGFAPWLKDPLWRKAQVAPSLDLRFADNKSLVDSVSGQSLVTFSRANSATYTDSTGNRQTATTNEPRFDHNPITGESLGLLVEEQRTNLLLRSEEFDNASWNKNALQAFGSGSVANAIAAPNGSVTADFLVEDTSNGEHFADQNFTAVSGTSYTFSAFIKPSANKTGVMLRYTTAVFGGITNYIQVVFATGVVTVLAGTPTGAATPLPNGWWRISITGTATANGSPSARIQFFQNNATNTNYTGDGTSGYYLWGAQLEAGAFATSYIPTTTAAATRAADVATITGAAFSSWYRQDEGTVFAEYTGVIAGVNRGVWALTADSSNSNNIIDFFNGGTSPVLRVVSSGVGQAYINTNTATTATFNKVASAFAQNNFARSLNGLAADLDTSGTMPATTPILLNIGTINAYGVAPLSGTIRRLTYFPARLSNTALQRMTQ
jgi:hypothetical protein